MTPSPTNEPLALDDPPATSKDVIRERQAVQDFVVLRRAVSGLIVAILIGIIGLVVLGFNQTPIPEGLIAIPSAAVGALATMLVSSAGRSGRLGP